MARMDKMCRPVCSRLAFVQNFRRQGLVRQTETAEHFPKSLRTFDPGMGKVDSINENLKQMLVCCR